MSDLATVILAGALAGLGGLWLWTTQRLSRAIDRLVETQATGCAPFMRVERKVREIETTLHGHGLTLARIEERIKGAR